MWCVSKHTPMPGDMWAELYRASYPCLFVLAHRPEKVLRTHTHTLLCTNFPTVSKTTDSPGWGHVWSDKQHNTIQVNITKRCAWTNEHKVNMTLAAKDDEWERECKFEI